MDTHNSPFILVARLSELWSSLEAKDKALEEAKASLETLTSQLTVVEDALKNNNNSYAKERKTHTEKLTAV